MIWYTGKALYATVVGLLLEQSKSYPTVPLVTPGNTIRLTWSNEGQSPPNKLRIPASAQSILVAEQLLSELFIEPVVSRMIIRSIDFELPPFVPAVAVVDRLTELIPNTLPKYVGTLACCLTTMP